MQKNEATKLALKLAGIYVLVQAIFYIPVVVSYYRFLGTDSGSLTGTITIFITFALLVVLGLWLTLKNKPKFEAGALASADLMRLGLAIAGIIILAIAVTDLPLLISKFVNSSTNPTTIEIIGINNYTENLMALIGNLIQLVLGGLLFLKAKYFARLIK